MKAFRCDRCSGFYTQEQLNKVVNDNNYPETIITHFYNGYGETKMDICPKCYIELQKFLVGK